MAKNTLLDNDLSKAENVYRLLREEIVTHALAIGELIDRDELCTKYQVSRFPVSDALSRLAREGLATVLPQRGSHVAPLSLTRIRSAAFLRRAAESEACRVIAADHAIDQALLDAAAGLPARIESGDRSGTFALDRRFHEMLIEKAAPEFTLDALAPAIALVERAWRVVTNHVGGLDAIEADHLAILEALGAGDGPAAAGAMRAHIDRMLDDIERCALARTELFEA